jgi:[acyl-carrier-protein] S-malonyltransferase
MGAAASTVWMFPGQGSQYPGMGRELRARWLPARRWIDLASEIAEQALQDLCVAGTARELQQPEVLEPILAAIALGYIDKLRAQGERPDCVAGYSAGELAALACAGVLSPETVLEIAVQRGRILQRVAAACPASMLAVAGRPAEHIARIVQAEHDVWISGWNAPDHVCIVGSPESITALRRRVRSLGADVTDVGVFGPWHTPLAAEATAALHGVLASLRFAKPRLPFYSGTTGARVDDLDQIRELLAIQISTPVRWGQLVTALVRDGIKRFVEVGPGHDLSGFVRRTVRDSPDHRICYVERSDGDFAPWLRRAPRHEVFERA